MKTIILGNGGHSKVIQEMLAVQPNSQLIAALDDRYQVQDLKEGIIYGPMSCLETLFEHEMKVIIAIGHNAIRKKIAQIINLSTNQYLSVVHPTAVVSPTAVIGNGTVIMPNAVINAKAKIGDHCIINTGAIIEHDCVVGDYAHVSPNATLTGNVSIGVGVHIGAGSTVIPGVNIENWSVIGAGSTVIESVPAYSKAVGSPTRIIERLLVN